MASTAWTASNGANVNLANGQPVYAASVQSQWVTIHADLEQTADASTVLREPLTSTNSGLRLVKVPPNCTRMRVRVKYTTAGTAGTNATVRIFALDTYSATGVLDTGGTVEGWRLDNVDDWAATGKTPTMNPTTDGRFGSFSVTNPVDIGDDGDLLGAASVIALVETAGALTSGTMILQGLFLN